MRIIEQSHKIEWPRVFDGELWEGMMCLLEDAGRTCYKSKPNDVDGPTEFVAKIIKRGHLSVIEHANITVRFITDRGVTHELVRHRLAAYSQESTRYCDYGGKDVQFILPVELPKELCGTYVWDNAVIAPMEPFPKGFRLDAEEWSFITGCKEAEDRYQLLRSSYDWSPQSARYFLPNGVKTEIVMTANLREWSHVLNLRCSKAAHPQIRGLMLSLLKELSDLLPVVFGDIYYKHYRQIEKEK